MKINSTGKVDLVSIWLLSFPSFNRLFSLSFLILHLVQLILTACPVLAVRLLSILFFLLILVLILLILPLERYGL